MMAAEFWLIGQLEEKRFGSSRNASVYQSVCPQPILHKMVLESKTSIKSVPLGKTTSGQLLILYISKIR
jgi:hypothetical protein